MTKKISSRVASVENQALVSIVTPVHNGAKFIAETVRTVCGQTYRNFEWIIVDDGSEDETLKVIEETKDELVRHGGVSGKIRVIKLSGNSGAAKARNVGIREAKGEYLCFLDADDLWVPEKLERQVKFMQKKKCGFSFHSYEFANEKCEPNGRKVIAKETLSYKQALKNNIISTITVMFDIKKINKKLLEMPDIKYVEDTATWWKVLRNGYIAFGIPDLFAYYRRTPKSNSSNKIKTQGSLWFLYRKVEDLSFFYSLHCLFWKNINATLRRI